MTEGQPVGREMLVEELVERSRRVGRRTAVMAAAAAVQAPRDAADRYGDIIREQSCETVTRRFPTWPTRFSKGPFGSPGDSLEQKRGVPRDPKGEPARFVVLGMGKLGGCELNYSSDIDLIFLYDGEGKTDGPRPMSNREFFERLARDVVRLLTETPNWASPIASICGCGPKGSAGRWSSASKARCTITTCSGRTWERQAFVKARPVAGDLDLGKISSSSSSLGFIAAI